jgi:hypothetical protein
MTSIQKDHKPGHGCGEIADLTNLVQQALTLADALELTFVGIDLCSALERLKSISDAARLLESSDHE